MDNCSAKFTIGLRTIKTALAVFICLLIQYVFHTESGFYSCIAAVVCMRETAGESWQIGRHRVLGTLIGGALGYLLVTAAQRMPHYHDGLYVVIIPLGMILCIWLCLLIDKKNGVIICCVVFIGIGLDPSMDKAMTLYNIILRIVDTTLGIVVAGLVNRYFFPFDECSEEVEMEGPPAGAAYKKIEKSKAGTKEEEQKEKESDNTIESRE